MEKYSSKIKELREVMLITQQELADKLFVSVVTVNRWENNKVQPTIKNRRALKKLFKKNKMEDK